MLLLLIDEWKYVLDQLPTLLAQRILDQLQELKPSDDSLLISKSFFKYLKLMFFEEEPVLAECLDVNMYTF
jgi:hypothetical protein